MTAFGRGVALGQPKYVGSQLDILSQPPASGLTYTAGCVVPRPLGGYMDLEGVVGFPRRAAVLAAPYLYVPSQPLHHRLDARSLGGTPRLTASGGLDRAPLGSSGRPVRYPSTSFCSNDSLGSPRCTVPPLRVELSV